MTRLGSRRGDERGMVLVLVSLAMTALLSVTALVIDLSQLRADRRVNKSVADTAVRAGLSRLQAGAWSGMCRARDYLEANASAGRFDPGSEQWFRQGSPATVISPGPCLASSRTTIPYITQCRPNDPTSWGKLTATAGLGRYAIEIRAGYSLPDSRFAEDALALTDRGDPLKGSCDNLAVIIRERRGPLFAGVMDRSDKITTIRSVGRLSQGDTDDYNPALLLLEQHGCAVLTATSENARVVAQPFQSHPGVIQIDSADDVGCSQNQAVLNGKATSAGPSIVACSASTTAPAAGCNLATANKPSRIGLHALNYPHASGDYVTSTYPGTYGDNLAVPSAQSGRAPIDEVYRTAVTDLDATAQSVLTGNLGRPPGCVNPVANVCTGTDGVWLVLQQADCNALDAFFGASAAQATSARIWFHCDLSVDAPLTLRAAPATA